VGNQMKGFTRNRTIKNKNYVFACNIACYYYRPAKTTADFSKIEHFLLAMLREAENYAHSDHMQQMHPNISIIQVDYNELLTSLKQSTISKLLNPKFKSTGNIICRNRNH
jgi:hypothetical protein